METPYSKKGEKRKWETQTYKDTMNTKMTRTQGKAVERTQAINAVKERSKSISLESDQGNSNLLKVVDLRPEIIGSRVGRPQIILLQRILGLLQLQIHR